MRGSTPIVSVIALVAVAVIGVLDYLSGVELRTFPLYYAPISLVAWYSGRSGALAFTVLCALSWTASNYLAGMRYSATSMWVANTLVQGVSFGTVGILIATLRRTLVREQALSRTDPLTSVLNSRAFYEESDRLLALCRRKGRPVTVAYVDLDGFKDFNDRDGHQAGDKVLRGVAELLRASIRPSDVFARLGGDEFALLLPEVSPAEAHALLDRLRSRLTSALISGTHRVTASIGAVTFMAPPGDVEVMVKEADARMYLAKTSGRNRVCFDVVAND